MSEIAFPTSFPYSLVVICLVAMGACPTNRPNPTTDSGECGLPRRHEGVRGGASLETRSVVTMWGGGAPDGVAFVHGVVG